MILFYITWAVWLASEIALNRLRRAGQRNAQNHDKRTMAIIWMIVALAIGAGIAANFLFDIPILRKAIIPYSGLAIIVSGMILRFIAVFSLGKFFTVDLAIHKEHHVIRTGIYHVIRHPSYLGSILSFLGFGLTLNNWISMVIVIAPVTAAFIYRIRVEEKLLIKETG